MANLAKTQGITVLTWQDLATGNVVLSGAQDVSTKLAATFLIHLGRKSGTAFTSGGPNVRVEASALAAGDAEWFPLVLFQPVVGANIANTTLNGQAAASATTFNVHTGTNIAAGDILFIGDPSTANYEIVRVKSISGGSDPYTVTPEAPLVNTHADAAIVTDQAELYLAQVDLTAIGRLRAVVDNANGGQTIAVEVLMVTGDSLS